VTTDTPNLWHRLTHRKVVQWTLAYVAVAYTLLHGAQMLAESLDWPHALIRLFTLILILGTPVVILLAWYHGEKGLKRVTGVELAILTILAIIAGTILWSLSHKRAEQGALSTATSATAPSSSPPAAITAVAPDKSIAVLPFVDMSEKHDEEYFSDGLSEELIDHLTHITDLKVIARTSSFAFKGKNEDMRTIATKLGVANLLEGSVRKAGGTLRITAQLIRASDGVHRWSEIYDRKLTDIFKVQDEISTTVAKALNVALDASKSGVVQPTSQGTTNVEAYNLVLQGNYIYDRGNQGDTFRAIERYQQALTLDPHYALAWANLARYYAFQGYEGELSSAEAEAKGRKAAERALASDPNCAEAYYARGNILWFISGDWATAKSEYEKAVALDSRSQGGIDAQGNILAIKAILSGQFRDLIDFTRRHLESNPLDTNDMWTLAWTQTMAGRLEDSAITSRKLLNLSPAYLTAQAQYGLTLLLMGKKSEALAAALKESDDASKLQVLASIYWAMGRRAESDSALSALERTFADRDGYMIAAAHAYRGEADAAYSWLDRAYRQRKGSLFSLNVDPLFRKLHGDSRFNALLRKMNLSE
jgi:serine/threonine-protein kinase